MEGERVCLLLLPKLFNFVKEIEKGSATRRILSLSDGHVPFV